MSDLADQQCEACRADSLQATQAQIDGWLPQLPAWQIIEVEGERRLCRLYLCDNFQSAMDCADKMAVIAALEDHHPALLVEWGRLTVSWWTHAINGLHKNDFIMAARTDALLGGA